MTQSGTGTKKVRGMAPQSLELIEAMHAAAKAAREARSRHSRRVNNERRAFRGRAARFASASSTAPPRAACSAPGGPRCL
jgi:hypothetical protein